MTESGNAPDLVGVSEASTLTGLDRRTLHRKVKRGELHAVSKLPGLRGALIFNRADITPLIPAVASSPEADAPAVPRPASTVPPVDVGRHSSAA